MTEQKYIDMLCMDDAQILLIQDNLTKQRIDEFERDLMSRASEDLRVSLEGVVKVLRRKLQEQNEREVPNEG